MGSINLATKYNRIVILLFTVAPFVGYLTYNVLDMDFSRVMQLLSYIGVLLLLLFRTGKNPIRFPKYILFYLLFVLYTFFSEIVLLDREFKLMWLFSNSLIGALNMMIIIENIPINTKFINLIVKISKIVLIIAFLVILIQQIFDSTFFVIPEEVESRVMDADDISESRLPSIFSWASGLAKGFSFVPIFIIIVEYLYRQKKKYIIWILIGFVYAFLTKSRWIMLNALLVFAILVIHHRYKLRQIFKLVLIVPVILVSSFFVMDSMGIGVDKIIENRVKSKTAGSRILAFSAFNRFFMNKPMLGVGNIKYGMGGTGKQDYELRKFLRRRSSQIHVGYLSLLYMYGIVGAFFFLSFLFLFIKRLYYDAKKTKIWGPFLGILGFVLANFTLVSFSLFEMGFIIALVINKYYLDANLRQKMMYEKEITSNRIEYT